jgi:hypothetical protein
MHRLPFEANFQALGSPIISKTVNATIVNRMVFYR